MCIQTDSMVFPIWRFAGYRYLKRGVGRSVLFSHSPCTIDTDSNREREFRSLCNDIGVRLWVSMIKHSVSFTLYNFENTRYI